MWLSKQMKPVPPTADAELGVTTIAGDSVGVITRGENRALPVYGPGGYIWLPESGAGVLTLRGGPGGAEQCVAGMKQADPPAGMMPGEVYLHGPGGSSVYLKQDGTVELKGSRISLTGDFSVNGKPYAPCDCGKEGG